MVSAEVRGEPALAASIHDVLVESPDNFSWLDKGDTILLKPALNSPDPYPATTHPLAIENYLKTSGRTWGTRGNRGPVRIERVLHYPGGVIRGNSRSNRYGVKG